jgi:signal transduction histidine kinase
LAGLVPQLWLLLGGRYGGWLAVVPLGTLLVHVGLERSRGRHTWPVVATMTALTLATLAAQGLPEPIRWAVQSLVASAGLASVSLRLARHASIPAAYRVPLVIGFGLLALNHLLVAVAPAGPAWVAVRLGPLVAGAVTLTMTAWHWGSDSGHAPARVVDDLVIDLAASEQQVVSSRQRLHDARSTLAGIRAARATLAGAGVSAVERSELERALETEIERLLRLLAGETAQGPTRLDDLLPPLVLTLRQRGVDLRYQPVAAEVAADPDTVAEIVGNLVDNAIEHAPGATVRLVTDRVGANVLLSVVDDGPGVPAELRDTVLEVGARRPGSRGEGLGLSAAAQLAASAGGELRLLAVERGAWFLLRLPASEAGQSTTTAVD